MGSLRKKTATKPLPNGAELFERKGQTFVRWLDSQGRKKTAATTTGKDGSLRIVIEAGTYTAKFRAADGTVREVPTGCRDRDAARAVLAELERREELLKAGVMTQAESGIADHAATPIARQFEAYREHRVTQELNAARIKSTHSRLKRLAKECGSIGSLICRASH
jgi:multidrug resistance efflux pump